MRSSLPNDLELSLIDPTVGARFSPNLHVYLSSPRHRSLRHFGRVFKDAGGVLWLGFCMDGDFVGVQLIHILSNGIGARLASRKDLANEIVEVEGFWERYSSVGRCAIDPMHKLSFAGDDNRWSVRGDRRDCMWCGDATQTIRRSAEPASRSERA